MPGFIKDWLLPLLLILSNSMLGWLINQLPSKQDLNISDSAIFWLTGVSIAALFIFPLLLNSSQQNSTLANQNWLGGFLPLLAGVILAIPLYFKLVPTEFSTVFSYVSIGMFGLGAILPPVLILPKPWRKKIVWLIPGATLFLTFHFIGEQQSTLAIVCLIFTITITFILISKNFWKPLITELSAIWKEWQRQGAASVAAWIKSKGEDFWIELTSPFQREYYQALIYKCRDYETQGLNLNRILELQKVFVPLKISENYAANVKQDIIQQHKREADSSSKKQIWDFLDKSEFRRMVILGAPGSGKTTLLRYLTLIYASKQEGKVYPQAPKLIPVLLYLREVRQEIITNKPPLPDLITKQVQHLKKRHPLNPPPNWFANKLKQNKCLLMLDGLDEVADEQERQQVSAWVDEEMGHYPNTTFILTSRPNGYKSARIAQQQVNTLEVQPFSGEEIQKFLHHWYLQTEVESRDGKEDEGVQDKAKEKADDLIQRIQNSRPLRAMAMNPLLLTMIATVHRSGNALPGKRVELYKEICQILLERRQRAKNLHDPLTASQKQSVLQVLALELMQRNTRAFTLSEGQSLIQHQLITLPHNFADANNFIKHIQNDCGLLVEKELGIYEFAHLSFQEYLAAVQIKESNQENLLITSINQSWWSETIRLYAAQINNASNLVRAVIDMPSPSVNALVLVCDYEEEGWRVEPLLRQQLTDKLDAGLESSEPEVFKLAAQVKLTRRLSILQPIDDTLEIDTSYITCAEYQLFIDEKYFSQTLNLQNTKFNAGNAKNPISKISWENALSFCNWLNIYTYSQIRNNNENNAVYYYRLPTLAEAQYCQRLGFWTIDARNTGKKRICIVKNRVSQDYAHIANYLIVEDWKKAAQETVKVMLKAANLQSEGEIDVASIKKLPCTFFSTIDLLWMQYSTGRFSWGVRESAKLPLTSNDPLYLWYLNASGNIKEIFEALVQKHLNCGIDRLSPLFAFNVVTINAKGHEIQWERHQAEYFTEDLGNSVHLEMVAIPSGNFLMGSPEGELKRYDSESPQHQVNIQQFCIGKYQVTQEQWRAVAGLPKVNRELKPDPSRFKGKKRPVEQISWYDAVEFCDRLTEHTKRNYRLPSEAEWEYACRAGTSTPFHFGETITSELANYDATYTYGAAVKGTHRQETTDVGSFGVANAFGLYDMHGNLWEWCLDDWHHNYEGAPIDGSAWFNDNNNLYQKQGSSVLRGGSWLNDPRYCRSAFRNHDARDFHDDLIGFRIVCAAGRIL